MARAHAHSSTVRWKSLASLRGVDQGWRTWRRCHTTPTRAACSPAHLTVTSARPCNQQWLPELSPFETSASGDFKVHGVGRLRSHLPALTSNNTPVGAEKRAVSSPSTYRGYCEVHRAADGVKAVKRRHGKCRFYQSSPPKVANRRGDSLTRPFRDARRFPSPGS
jgi:hypothetical protein